jgi:hypothetical protein
MIEMTLYGRGGQPFWSEWDVSLDDHRILAVEPDPGQSTTELQVVLNWFDDLKRRAPAGK